MLKRIEALNEDGADWDVGSSSEEGDSELSDIDTSNLNTELELGDINEEVTLDNPKYAHLEPHELGRERKRVATKKASEKEKLSQILEGSLPHQNERPRKTRYINKQRTLVFCTRGINQRMRHFMQDLRELLPHSKTEPKFEDKRNLSVINEICDEHNCNNCIFLESRRHTDLYMWLSRVPNGPSCKFLVSNVHTMAELRLTGNCLKYSRPMLVFDKKFDDTLQTRIWKEMFTQMFGTPNGHPKSKPFVDHVFSFMIVDHKIWFRNYQIVFDADHNVNADSTNNPNPVLVEIGPRFVLHPTRILQGSFQGSAIYQDSHFINPNAERRAVRKQKQLVSAIALTKKDKKSYASKVMQRLDREERDKDLNNLDQDPEKLTNVFTMGTDFGAAAEETKMDESDEVVNDDGSDFEMVDVESGDSDENEEGSELSDFLMT